jgi:hypothetical protein
MKFSGYYTNGGEFNRCFISGHIVSIKEDRCSVLIRRTASDELVYCVYKKNGKNKLPQHFEIGDYIVFNGKLMPSKLTGGAYHVFYARSAFKHAGTEAEKVKNNCELTGFIKSYKKIDDELVVAELFQAEVMLKLYFKRNYRFILYDFENKYTDLTTTQIYVHGHFKLDGIWVDDIREVSRMSQTIERRIN